MATDYTSQITGLYNTFLGRAPDSAGMAYWNNDLNNGQSLADVAHSFMASPEFAQHMASMTSPTSVPSTSNTSSAPNPSSYGFGSSGSTPGANYSLGSNPFQGEQATAITNASNMFLNNAMNGIKSNYVGIGGLGGTREGVAQGVAAGQAANYLQGNLANLYGSNWNADQNRALSQYQGDQSFYTAQRGQDLQQMLDAAQMYNLSQNGAWTPFTNYGNLLSGYTGFGNSTGTTSQGGGAVGALGGGLGTLQLLQLLSKGS